MKKVKGKVMDSMYYDFSKLNSYDATIKAVISIRGLGKTFGKITSLFKKAINQRCVILYLVELETHLKTLGEADGRKFMSQLWDMVEPDRLKYTNNCVYYNYQPELKDGEWVLLVELFDLSSFGKAKRTKHSGIKYVIFDECIEVANRRNTFRLSKAFTSVIESFCRNNDVEIWLFGNVENSGSEFVKLLKIDDEDNIGYYYTYNIKGVTFAVHYVDAEYEYPKFYEKKNESTVGKITKLFDDSLQNNRIATGIRHLIAGKGTYYHAKPKQSFMYEGEYYNVYWGRITGDKMIIEHVIAPFHAKHLALTRKDKGEYNQIVVDNLCSMAFRNRLLFSNTYCYSRLKDILKIQ